jgi:DnaJ-domain-containing protein 1
MLTRKILTELNNMQPQEKSRKLWQIVAVGAGAIVLVALLFVSNVLALVTFAVGVACVWFTYKRDEAGQTISLVYDDLDAETGARFSAAQDACEALAASERIWRVADKQGGAPKSRPTLPVDRKRVAVGRLQPPGLSANVPIWGIDAEDLKVFFLPEAILLYERERYRALSYESFEVAFSSGRVLEEEEVPEDAEVVGRTWRYTMANGKRDPRHTSNQQLSVVLYALLRITGSSGLRMSLQVSNRSAAARFAQMFGAEEPSQEKGVRDEPPPREASHSASGSDEEQEEEGAYRSTTTTKEAKKLKTKIERAYETLGLTNGASMKEIVASYRELARAYHPDKVATLAPEIREFADNKMKEINAAYAELKLRRT